MRAKLTIAAAVLLLFSVTGRAAPLDPAVQQELLGLYDRYNKAIMAGKLPEAAALRTASARKELLASKSKADRADTLMMARMMAPDQVAPIHASIAADGRSARIVTIGTKTVTANMKIPGGPKPGTVGHGEITLTFEREGQDWKFADQLFGPDPAVVKTCRDDAPDAGTDYDSNATTTAAGLIRRVEFKPDHTLVVVRIANEENCLILPPRDRLSQLDPRADHIVPWAVIEIEGVQNSRDKQRVRADKWTVTDE